MLAVKVNDSVLLLLLMCEIDRVVDAVREMLMVPLDEDKVDWVSLSVVPEIDADAEAEIDSVIVPDAVIVAEVDGEVEHEPVPLEVDLEIDIDVVADALIVLLVALAVGEFEGEIDGDGDVEAVAVGLLDNVKEGDCVGVLDEVVDASARRPSRRTIARRVTASVPSRQSADLRRCLPQSMSVRVWNLFLGLHACDESIIRRLSLVNDFIRAKDPIYCLAKYRFD